MAKYNIQMSEEYAELAEEVIAEYPDLEWIHTTGVGIGFLTSEQEKKKHGGLVYAECHLVKSIYQPFCPHDFLVIVYLPNVCRFSDEQKRILLYHELLHVGMDEKNGEPVYRIVPHDVEDFMKVIRRYGADWAAGR